MEQAKLSFFHHAFSSVQVINSLKMSLIVGSLLNIINQWDGITGAAPVNWVQLLLTFLVPYCVSTYAGAKASVRCDQTHGPGG